MNRKWVWALVGVIGLSIVLAVTVAMVGSQVDDLRLERDDLEVEVEELHTEVDGLLSERDTLRGEQTTLKTQFDDQLRTIEQLKAELERARAQAQQPTPAEPTQPAAQVTP